MAILLPLYIFIVCTQQLHKAELKNLYEELAAVRSELRTALQTTVSTTNAIQTIETEVKELRTIVNSQAQNVLE